MQDDKETTRIEIFSDGTFAITITLLVLEIKAPGHGWLRRKVSRIRLAGAWRGYLAFFVSFVTILAIWAHHHWMSSRSAAANVRDIQGKQTMVHAGEMAASGASWTALPVKNEVRVVLYRFQGS
jgi:uncharacterized membrane protein